MGLSIFLVTGQSGSGKSTALRALEDCGYYCVDNLPSAVFEDIVVVLTKDGSFSNLALGMDIRDRRFITDGAQLITRLRKADYDLRVLFLEADTEAIVRRYSETRRRHPLDDGCGILVAIEREREILSQLRELADDTLNTSHLSSHGLRARVIEHIDAASEYGHLRIAFLSFGFKYGLPLESDLVLDVRFLPNPYYDAMLRERTGLDNEVYRYALGSPMALEFLQKATEFLSFLIPQYEREHKRYLTVAIGCTGGRHRSVAVVQALAERLSKRVPCDVRHREIEERKL